MQEEILWKLNHVEKVNKQLLELISERDLLDAEDKAAQSKWTHPPIAIYTVTCMVAEMTQQAELEELKKANNKLRHRITKAEEDLAKYGITLSLILKTLRVLMKLDIKNTTCTNET